MKTRIELSPEDVVTVLQVHAASLVRMDFEPEDLKILVRSVPTEPWAEGDVSVVIEVEAESADVID